MTIKEAFPDAMAAGDSSPTVLKQISHVSPLLMFITNDNIYKKSPKQWPRALPLVG